MRRLVITSMVLLSTLLFIKQDLKAQSPQPFFEHYTIDDGLSMNSVTAILQDHKGLMWFGTRGEGLNCWDGYRFTVYKHNSQDPHSLRNDMIDGIYEDSENNLWIYTWKGINLFDRQHNIFIHDSKLIHSTLGIKKELDIRSLFEDSQLNLWITTLEGGLKLPNKSDSTLTSYFGYPDRTDSSIYNPINSIYEDRSGVLWVGTDDGLYQFDREDRTFSKYLFKDLEGKILSDELFVSIYQDYEGNYWLTGKGWEGLSLYNPKKGTLIKFKPDPSNTNSLSDERLGPVCEDSNKNLWIGTMTGLNLYDRTNDRFYHFKNKSNEEQSISSNPIKCIYADQNGNVWIGTIGGGINFLRGHQNPFKNYTHDVNNQNSLSHPNVTSFYERKDGNIWVGTGGGGLNLFNPDQNTFTHYKAEAGSKDGLISNEITSNMLEDIYENLWIVAGSHIFKGGLHKYHLSDDGRRLRYLKEEVPGNLSNEIIYTLCEVSRGEIWVGGLKGLWRYNQENDFLSFYPKEDKLGPTYRVFEDSKKNIWAGTKIGLFLFSRENNSFTVHGNSTVYGINEDMQGNIIVQEGDFIQYRYDLKNDTSTIFYDATQHGAARGDIKDDAGNFWLSTQNGINKFNPVTGEVRNYNVGDGLISNGFNGGALLKSSKGEFYFGSSDGFSVFHPDSLKDNPDIPPIVITDFRLFNQTVPVSGTTSDTSDWQSPLKQSITYTTDIKLTYKHNIFSFEFAALNYIDPEKNLYKYKLEGFNDDWIYTDAGNRLATYTNLDPGTYRFIVKGSNNDGKWNETGASIGIRILPPPWRSWWAYTLYLLVVAGLIFGAIRFLLIRQYLKGKLELEQMELKKIHELDQMKTQFFANISHEFRTPLTLIQGPLRQMLKRETNNDNRNILSMMERNGRRLLFLINQLLDFSKLESGHLPLQASGYDIVDFLKKLFPSFESLARSRNINYVFQSDTGKLLVYFDRDKLEKVIVNLITNAFKFTRDGDDIFVKLSKKELDPNIDRGEGIVEMQVEDTGIGISSEKLSHIFDRFYQVSSSDSRMQEGTGIGLALVKDLVKLHHGSVSVTSKKGRGSTFTVHLPLGKDHLSRHELLMESEDPSELIYENSINVDEIRSRVKNQEDGEYRLLIIDDNLDMRYYVREVLTEDFFIEEACDGKEGLSFAIENLPDLIISDVMMPEIDGNELCRKLKTDERTSHIPVVMLTAKAGESARLEGFETGADDYITKPFSPVELKVRVRNIIDQRKKLRERFSRDITLQPRDLAITSADERFLLRAQNILKEKSSKSEFTADMFSKEMAMSRAQLHRKLKALTDQSAREFIRSYKLNHARQLLEGRYGNMAEIAYESGFSNPSYFAECFKKQFGVLPSEYVNHKAQDKDN